MAVKGGPNIVTQGLNLSLDSGNKKSIPLDPTVNQYLNPQFLNNTASWQFGSWDNPIYTYQTVNAPGPDGTTVPMLKITRVSGSTGAAHFHQGNSGKYYSGSVYTMTAFVSGSGTFTGRHQNLGVLGTYTLSNSWQRVAYTFTQPNNTNYPYWAADQITFNESLYFVYAQSENLPYASPYVSGSRTNWNNMAQINTTASLSSGSVSSSMPQFQSLGSGILNFDGTGSYSQTNTIITGNTYTFETVFSASTLNPSVEKWLGSQYPGNNRVIFDIYIDNYLRNFVGSGTNPSSATVLSTTIIQPSKWYHAVFTKDALGTGSIYVNGVLEATGALGLTTPPAVPFQIGGSTTLTRWFSGKIPIAKLYNRALTADEVKQNYNALKTRFGL